MKTRLYSAHACPFCGTLTVRILQSYELNAIRAGGELAEGVAAYQCASAHIFFVTMEKREAGSEGLRSMGKAAGS